MTLDLRLGVRMLVKYPGLTTVGVVGMGMTVAIAAMLSTFVEVITGPELPLPEGDRIVGMRLWDRREIDFAPTTAHDLIAWKEQLTSLEAVAAGMYALMSFTVTRRRREIGIRAALGAQPRRVTVSVLAHALRQLAMGAVAGVGVGLWLERWTGGMFMGGRAVIVLPAVLVMMIVTGGLAALGPARRSLRVHPAEALKAE